MQRFFHSAFCLTLVMTGAMADGYRTPPGSYGASGWRPIDTPTLDQSTPGSKPADAYARQPSPYRDDSGAAPAYNPAPTGSGPYGAPPPYGTMPEQPPYGYGYGGWEPPAQPYYSYPPANNPDPWGYPAYPGNSQPPVYGYPYQDGGAPGYSPYDSPADYGYPAYGEGYYDPAAPATGYGSAPYPGYDYRSDDLPYGAPAAPAPPGYGSAPGYPAPGQEQAPYPAYGYDQAPAYPAQQQNPALPGAGPNPGTDRAPAPPTALQPGGYRVNGAPAVFRPWTDPEEEPAPEQSTR